MLRQYALSAILLLSPATAVAQDADPMRASASTYISGFVTSNCTVDVTQDQAVIDIATTALQDVSEIHYVCNSPSGFTRRITSAGAGALVRGAQSVPYSVSQSGDGGLSFPPLSLSSAFVSNVPASPIIVNGTTGQLRVSIPGQPSNLLAGEYSDTVTIELTPN